MVNTMANLQNNAIISFQLDGRIDGQQLLLTHHFRIITTPPTSFDMQTVCDELFTWANTADNICDRYVNCLSQQVTGIVCHIQAIHPTRYVKTTYTPAASAGEVLVAAFPPNVAHAITTRCEQAGKHFRGTKHIGGVPTTFSANGLMEAAALTVYDILGSQFEVAPDLDVIGLDGSLVPVVYNRSSPSTSAQIISHVVQSTTRVERRRTVGLGT